MFAAHARRMFILWTALGIIGIAVITIVALVIYVRMNGPAILEAQRQFFTQTGYRHPEIPNAPVEEQVKFVPRRVGMADALRKGKRETRYVKPDPAGALEYTSMSITEAVAGGTMRSSSESWRLALGTPARLQLQIADKRLVSKGNVKDHFGRTRSWTQRYSSAIELDDAALAGRFAVFGDDAAAIRRVLARPDVRERLLGFAEVDLVVDDGSIVLSDPSGKNRKAGRIGGPRIVDSIPVHQNVQAMLGAIRDEVTAQR
jgi:hypothetical protein